MKKKILASILVASGLITLTPSIWADAHQDVDQLADKINQRTAELQKEIAELQSQVKSLNGQLNQQKSASDPDQAVLMDDPAAAPVVTGNVNRDHVSKQLAHGINQPRDNSDISNIPTVSIAPYIGVKTQFDGSELIVNNPSINDDAKILSLRKLERAKYIEEGKVLPDHPRLIFSGELESQVSYGQPYTGSDQSNIDLTDAELDALVEFNHVLTGYMVFSYDNDPANALTPSSINNSNVDLSQGFVTYGDFDVSPLYATVGQYYVPFGKYSSYMVSSTLPKSIGRIKARAITGGYHGLEGGWQPYGAIYAFSGDTDPHNDSNIIGVGGANLGIHFDDDNSGWVHDFGISAVSNMAESDGIQGDGDNSDPTTFTGLSQTGAFENIDHRIPGVDVHAVSGYGPYTLIGEYVTATRHFNANEVSFDGHGAKPAASDLELAYSFVWHRPSSVSVSYQRSWEALAFGLPEERYALTYSVSVWRHTLISLEFDRDTGYDSGTTASGYNYTGVSTGQLGNHYNSVILQLDAYF